MRPEDLYNQLNPLDVFFTQSGTWMSKAIRWAEREPGEAKSTASHVGAIVTAGTIRQVVCVEALHKVRRHKLSKKYGGKSGKVCIWRPRNVREIDQVRILEGLEKRVGQRYGYAKIGLHLARKVTGRRKWLNFSFLDSFPICSYLVAIEFERRGYDFGVKARKANPDDMLDFMMMNPDKWECVRPWATVPA